MILAGISGLIWGVDPIHPFFIIGVILAVGGLIYGIIAVRCPFCYKQLPLKGLGIDEFCPHCGKKI